LSGHLDLTGVCLEKLAECPGEVKCLDVDFYGTGKEMGSGLGVD